MVGIGAILPYGCFCGLFGADVSDLLYGIGPVGLVVDIGEEIGEACLIAVDVHVADYEFNVNDEPVAEHVAVEVFTAVAVVVADKIDDIAVLDRIHGLCSGCGLAFRVDASHADNGAVGFFIGKFKHKLGTVAVV